MIHFNPNQMERSLTAESLYKKLNPVSIYGYHDILDNFDSKCTYLTWMQIYFTFTKQNKNPFRFRTLRLIPYNKQLKKYIKKL